MLGQAENGITRLCMQAMEQINLQMVFKLSLGIYLERTMHIENRSLERSRNTVR